MESVGADVPAEYVWLQDFLYDDGLAAGRRSSTCRIDRPRSCRQRRGRLGILEAARARVLRVPEDLSVVGYDDTEVARLASPPLTTVKQPLREMGAVALRTALQLAAGESVSSHHVELATSLIIRGSAAPTLLVGRRRFLSSCGGSRWSLAAVGGALSSRTGRDQDGPGQPGQERERYGGRRLVSARPTARSSVAGSGRSSAGAGRRGWPRAAVSIAMPMRGMTRREQSRPMAMPIIAAPSWAAAPTHEVAGGEDVFPGDDRVDDADREQRDATRSGRR
jgi:hypothetical protein